MKSNNKTYHFAVFGDIHGRIALMYTLAFLYQNESGIKLSGILQVGDMGAFPNPDKIDKATAKYAKKDPDELGFQKFCIQTEEGEFYLNRENTPNTYFIRGNHEDFDYLNSFSQPTTVDPWQRLHFIPDGQLLSLFPPRNINIAGFGGIAPRTEDRGRGKTAREKYRQAIASDDPRFFSQEMVQSAFHDSENIDILMTHAGPQCPELIHGSIYLAELATRINPKVHLFGHHHQVVKPCKGPGNSLLVGLEHLDFNENGELKKGAWGILTLSEDSAKFSFSSPQKIRFLKQIKRDTYRSLLNI
jgi:predicted phosphohydrolase